MCKTMNTSDFINRIAQPHPLPSRTISALGMFSGGLDSLVAVAMLRDLGIMVNVVTFESPFFNISQTRQAADNLGVPLHIDKFGPTLVSIIQNPTHGFGAQLNPCIDCHIAMLRRTGELMESMGHDFIFTGEVLNQRPMSQNPAALRKIAQKCGYAPLLLRPLSAGLLEPTIPELKGWVPRKSLGKIDGRSRREQLRLAERYGIKNIPPVAGGCRLTEPNFARRLKDLKDHEGLRGMRAINLLKIGRHLRLNQSTKLIVGRNERDNIELEGNAELYDLLLKPEAIPGPTVLVPITIRSDALQMAAAICARYSDAAPGQTVRIRIRSTQGMKYIETQPAAHEFVEPLLI